MLNVVESIAKSPTSTSPIKNVGNILKENDSSRETHIDISSIDTESVPTDNFSEIFNDVLSLFKPNKDSTWRETLKIYRNNSEFLIVFLGELFRLVHASIYNKKSLINKYNIVVGKSWANFSFPLTTSNTPTKVRDSFFNSFPYFATHAIHKFCIFISKDDPQVLTQSFRMSVCKTIVKAFTSLSPLESQLLSTLQKYFFEEPDLFYDEKEIENSKDNKDGLDNQLGDDDSDILTDVQLPVEDLSTLTEIQKRKKPKNSGLHMTGISTLMSLATNHRSVPFEHDAYMVIQYPEGGEADWTSDLPPLLPPLKNNDKVLDSKSEVSSVVATTTKRNKEYNPMNESRSLLHRSRRPNICDKVYQLKKQFISDQLKRHSQQVKLEKDLSDMKRRLIKSDKLTMDRFISDLRILQKSSKRNETPELPEEKPKVVEKPQQINNVVPCISNERKVSPKNEDIERKLRESNNLVRHTLEMMRTAHDNCVTNSVSITPEVSPNVNFSAADFKPSSIIVNSVVSPILDVKRERKKELDELVKQHASTKQKLSEAEQIVKDIQRAKT